MNLAPRGRCLNYGTINKPWTSQRCHCTGWTFKRIFYGQPLCQCGDLYLQHAINMQMQGPEPEEDPPEKPITVGQWIAVVIGLAVWGVLCGWFTWYITTLRT